MKLKKLLDGIDCMVSPIFLEKDIRSLATDSRDISRGGLFVAIEGFRVDGHNFIDKALKNGALAVIAAKRPEPLKYDERIIQVADTRKALSVCAKNFYRSPSETLRTVGITGTNGKTTTALLIENIFGESGIPCGVIGTIEYRLGKTRLPSARTTPDALYLNRLLRGMLDKKLKAVVMEVSSHALDQKRVDDIFFDAAIFTNLTHEHLDYHGDLNRYFLSKMKIFLNLKKNGVAILNADDKRFTQAKKNAPRKAITFGLKRPATVSAAIKTMGLDGSSFAVRVAEKERFCVNTKMVGLHNVSNILAASALGFSLGLAVKDIKNGIEKTERVRGRLESVEAGQGFKVLIDYAHTHNALENVLNFLNQIKKRNIITVFGCGGERDTKKRPLMARVAQKLSDSVIVTNDNPRSEDPRKIVRDIEKGFKMRGKSYDIILDRSNAIAKALEKAGEDDIVLIAGKGHEEMQIMRNRQVPFNDRAVAEKLLRKSAKNRK